MDYCKDSITNNKLTIIAVTSAAEGMIESEGYKYGEGKSTFAIWFNKHLHEQFQALQDPWEAAFQNLGYTWDHLYKAVDEAFEHRKICYVQDDTQLIAGKSHSRNQKVQEWAEWIHTSRPFFAIIIFTCPSIDNLAKSWRDLVDFEIKIPTRGIFEVQQIKTRTIYKDPLNPAKHLKYLEDGTFPALPPKRQKRYTAWRKESSYTSAPHKHETKTEDEERYKRAPVDVVHQRLQDQGHDISRADLREAEMAAATPI